MAGTGQLIVLVVDDDIDMRQLLGFALEPSGYRVLTAEGGEEALRLLQSRPGSRPADFVLSDCQMPGGDGPPLLWQVAERWPSVYRLLMTGLTDGTAVAACPPGTVCFYKPILPDRIESALLALAAGQEPDCDHRVPRR